MMAIDAWLMGGDPAIRWQTMEDLLGAAPACVAAERARVASEGWGAELLAAQDPDGGWAGALYSPKWTSTTYTRSRTLPRRGAEPDERLSDAIDVVRRAQRTDGTWPLHRQHPGRYWFPLESRGASRWSTLRALRVLAWWDR